MFSLAPFQQLITQFQPGRSTYVVKTAKSCPCLPKWAFQPLMTFGLVLKWWLKWTESAFWLCMAVLQIFCGGGEKVMRVLRALLGTREINFKKRKFSKLFQLHRTWNGLTSAFRENTGGVVIEILPSNFSLFGFSEYLGPCFTSHNCYAPTADSVSYTYVS